MLKARHCYANENAFHNALFREKATVHSYALNPAMRVQIKFLIGNEETAVTERENIFFILDENFRSRAFNLRDAENLLNFIAIIRDKRVTTYQDAGLVYDVTNSGGKTRRYIRAAGQMGNKSIISNDNMVPLDIKMDPEYAEKYWEQSLDRFEEIIQEFVDLCSGKQPAVSSWFVQRRYLMLPLHNKHNGIFKVHSLRLNWTHQNKLNAIAFQSGDRTILFYESHEENSSTLNEVVEGFIDAIYRLVDVYKAKMSDDINMFVKAVPVHLTKDRESFMEYVGARGVGGESADGPYTTMIISVNSDATPSWSKTHFHYTHEFLCDLIDGLRICANYEI